MHLFRPLSFRCAMLLGLLGMAVSPIASAACTPGTTALKDAYAGTF